MGMKVVVSSLVLGVISCCVVSVSVISVIYNGSIGVRVVVKCLVVGFVMNNCVIRLSFVIGRLISWF